MWRHNSEDSHHRENLKYYNCTTLVQRLQHPQASRRHIHLSHVTKYPAMKPSSSSVCVILPPSIWRDVSPKRRMTFNALYCVISRRYNSSCPVTIISSNLFLYDLIYSYLCHCFQCFNPSNTYFHIDIAITVLTAQHVVPVFPFTAHGASPLFTQSPNFLQSPSSYLQPYT
jgi:hypothetical protein